MMIREMRREMLEIGIFGGRIAISEVILFSIFLADILMLGLINEISLSAALLVNSTFVLFFVTALGFLQGALPLASAHWEKADKPRFFATVMGSLIIAALIAGGVVTLFAGYVPLLRMLGFADDLLAEAQRYIIFILPGYALAFLYIAVRNAVIATGDSSDFMTLSLSALLLNVGLNWVLGFGVSVASITIPGLGIAGIGLASSLVEIFLLTGFTLLLWRTGFRPVRMARDQMRQVIGEQCRLGLPVGVLFFVDSTLFSAILIIVGRHDVQGMAALALIFEWIALAVMVPVGLSEAIIQRVSALRASGGSFQILVMACMCLSGLYLAVLALIQFGFGINMPALFILEGEAHPALMLLLNEYALMGFGVAIMYSHVIIVAGILRGLLDVMASMIAVVLCYWVVGIGLTLIFVEIMGLGSRHALIAVLLSAVLAALSISWQLHRSGRKFG